MGALLNRALVDCADAWPPNVAVDTAMAAVPASFIEVRLVSWLSRYFTAIPVSSSIPRDAEGRGLIADGRVRLLLSIELGDWT